MRLLSYSKYNMRIAQCTATHHAASQPLVLRLVPAPVKPPSLGGSCLDLGAILELLAARADAFSADICAQVSDYWYQYKHTKSKLFF